VRENLSEEELVIFDILTRPAPALSADERAEVKKVARDLLSRLKTLLVLNWRQKSAARSSLKLAIEDTLDSGLPRAYTPELYGQKCSAIFEHEYESYPEGDAGVYAGAGGARGQAGGQPAAVDCPPRGPLLKRHLGRPDSSVKAAPAGKEHPKQRRARLPTHRRCCQPRKSRFCRAVLAGGHVRAGSVARRSGLPFASQRLAQTQVADLANQIMNGRRPVHPGLCGSHCPPVPDAGLTRLSPEKYVE